MNTTSIEWTEKTWNPLAGCDKVSAGCKNCYAINMAYRLAHIGHSKEKYAPTVEKTAGGNLNWSGVITYDNKALIEPLQIKKPTMFFVNSMSDLFHKDVPLIFIAEVFAVMFHCTQHTFQVLTKRADRMHQVLTSDDFKTELVKAVDKIHQQHYGTHEVYGYDDIMHWYPFKNVWLGVSVEDQKAADERIASLCMTPAAVRWLSCEPLLGPLDIKRYLPQYGGAPLYVFDDDSMAEPIDWVVCGGESGHDARPMHPEWVRSLLDQCNEAAVPVPFFFKQWGKYLSFEAVNAPWWIASNTGNNYDGHEMNFTEEGEPGAWCTGRWMDGTEAQIYCEATGNTPVMFLGKTKGKKWYPCIDGKEYKQYPKK